MATKTGTHVNFVKVPKMAQFKDLTNNGLNTVEGTVYFIVDEKKIHLDGVMYGFNDSDVEGKFLPITGGEMQGDIDMRHNNMSFMGGNLRAPNIYDAEYISSFTKGDTFNTDQIEFGDFGITIRTVGEDGDESGYVSFTPDGLSMGNDVNKNVHLRGLTPLDETDVWDMADVFDTFAVSVQTLRNILNGNYAELDAKGQVPSAQLPSYVDDVLEYANKASFPAADKAEKGKLYIDLSNNNVWRWGGSAYVNVSDGNAHLKLGTTSSTAYRGDHGLAAYKHISVKEGNPHGVTASDVKLGSVVNQGLATKAQAEAGTINTAYMTPARTKEAILVHAPKLSWKVVE